MYSMGHLSWDSSFSSELSWLQRLGVLAVDADER